MKDLRKIGLSPIVEDSNGKGGYHVWLLLASPLPYDKAHSFGRWIAGDEEIEVFPKQKRIGDYGNQLRLPGQHHKEEHWSKIWDWSNKRWAEGDEAAQLLLSAPTADPNMIPQEAFAYVPPAENRTMMSVVVMGRLMLIGLTVTTAICGRWTSCSFAKIV